MLRRRLQLCLVSCGSRQGLVDDPSGGVEGLMQCSICIDRCQPHNDIPTLTHSYSN